MPAPPDLPNLVAALRGRGLVVPPGVRGLRDLVIAVKAQSRRRPRLLSDGRGGPPGPPPRPHLQWKPSTHRWINPGSGEEHDHPGPGEDLGPSKTPKYAVTPGLSAEDARVERDSQRHARDNYADIRAAYLDENGHRDANGDLTSVTVNTDEWRHHLPGYTGTNAGAVHEAASDANKRLYAELLRSQKGKGNNRLMVLAGGGGSGKGTAVGDYFVQQDYPLVLDQVSDNLAKLEAKLDEARTHGFEPEYVFVDRHPEQAWGGVVGRAVNLRKKGKLARTVPLPVALHANIAARRTALELLKKRPDVRPAIIDNNGGDLNRRLITDRGEAIAYLERKLAEVDESGLRERLHADVLTRHAAGEIPDDIAAGFVGKEAVAANPRAHPPPTG